MNHSELKKQAFKRPGVKAAYEEMEPEFSLLRELLRARHNAGLSQAEIAEKMLAEERNLLRTLIDNLPELIYAKDTKSRFTVANISIANIMGKKTSQEIIGKTDFDFFPHKLAAQYRADEQEKYEKRRRRVVIVSQQTALYDHVGVGQRHPDPEGEGGTAQHRPQADAAALPVPLLPTFVISFIIHRFRSTPQS